VTARRAIGALAGGLGVAAGVVTAAIVAAALLVTLGLPDQGRADATVATPARIAALGPAAPPAELVVALSLGDPALQAGVVRDGRVVLARGLEVEVMRAVARRLRIRTVRFVDVRPSSRLLAAGMRPWGVAVASVRPTRAAAASADLSIPYLGTDQAVVPRRGLPKVRALADLRSRVTCAVRGSDGAAAIGAAVRPRVRPLLAPSSERLLELVRTGVCDAGLVDATGVGRLLAGQGGGFGPVTARVEFGQGLVVAVTRDGPVAVADVDRALRRLRADGTLHRLARTWLGIDPARLRLLR
jgi:ABC-type amino acid transport substrate-binding protein